MSYLDEKIHFSAEMGAEKDLENLKNGLRKVFEENPIGRQLSSSTKSESSIFDDTSFIQEYCQTTNDFRLWLRKTFDNYNHVENKLIDSYESQIADKVIDSATRSMDDKENEV